MPQRTYEQRGLLLLEVGSYFRGVHRAGEFAIDRVAALASRISIAALRLTWASSLIIASNGIPRGYFRRGSTMASLVNHERHRMGWSGRVRPRLPVCCGALSYATSTSPVTGFSACGHCPHRHRSGQKHLPSCRGFDPQTQQTFGGYAQGLDRSVSDVAGLEASGLLGDNMRPDRL